MERRDVSLFALHLRIRRQSTSTFKLLALEKISMLASPRPMRKIPQPTHARRATEIKKNVFKRLQFAFNYSEISRSDVDEIRSHRRDLVVACDEKPFPSSHRHQVQWKITSKLFLDPRRVCVRFAIKMIRSELTRRCEVRPKRALRMQLFALSHEK
jgi:hypothetical protein